MQILVIYLKQNKYYNYIIIKGSWGLNKQWGVIIKDGSELVIKSIS